MRCITYRLNIGESFCDAFHTFCHILKGEVDDDGEDIPSKSILRSPFQSMGIGWASVEGGAEIGLASMLLSTRPQDYT